MENVGQLLDRLQAEKVQKIVCKLNLNPHPEGGFYSECYRSNEEIVPPARMQQESRSCGSSIYFLMLPERYSAWHKIDADEQWCFHEGSPVILRTLDENTGEMKQYKLGSVSDEAMPQVTINHGLWFCAEVERPKEYSLVGCQVFPAFEFECFTLANKGFWFKFNQHQKAREIYGFLPPSVKEDIQAEIREREAQRPVVQEDAAPQDLRTDTFKK